MRRPFTCLLVSCCLLLSLLQRAAAQDNIIMQGFYWNTIPGDVTNVTTGGIWWDTIATVAPLLKNSGFNVLWTPPAQKGFAGIYDMGYGIADYYDYGQFNQHGTIRTRHGNLTQLQNAITTLKNNNLKVMADVVLNHRAGAFDQQLEECDVPNDGRGRELRYTKFNNASGRMNWDSSFFHPNNHHCDLNPEYHNRSFFEDICYFNRINSILDPTKPNNGWYFAQHNLGVAGDSLVIVGRHMIDTMGFDMVRLDAVKHIEPGFLAPFLVELKNGTQPFAVGESYEGNATLLRNYQQEVANFNTSFGAGGKNAQMGIFDFALRFGLQSMAHDGTGAYDMQNLNSLGLVLMPGGLNANNVVTFVENHDFDRGGYRVVTCPGGPGTLQIGNTCLEYFFQSDHAPILRDKHMLYAYILGAEGHPTVFWKDFFWYDLDDEITWLIALRKQFAKGTTTPMSFLGASGGSFSLNDYFIFRRNGTTGGVSDGAMIGLNDNPNSNQETFVTTAFSNRYLKDYSDGFMFVTRQAANDGRASLPTAPRDYSWWAPTGLYPKPDGVVPSYFNMNASTGGCPHFVALKVSDAANFIVNGAPIAAGDEVAIKNTSGQVVGIGRIGQGFKWNGTHDMLIEVLGSPSTNGMANGENFSLF
ncbi:MAG: alpha-amylase family glycosyl hydrolase, partial [Saprospiraceae bacterium]